MDFDELQTLIASGQAKWQQQFKQQEDALELLRRVTSERYGVPLQVLRVLEFFAAQRALMQALSRSELDVRGMLGDPPLD